MTKKTDNKFIKGLKFTAKWAYKICIAAAGGVAIYSNPVTGAIAGASLIASTVSSVVKDKNLAKFGTLTAKVINHLSQNDGYAANDPKVNR